MRWTWDELDHLDLFDFSATFFVQSISPE